MSIIEHLLAAIGGLVLVAAIVVGGVVLLFRGLRPGDMP